MDETSQQAGSQSSAHESTPVFAARDATPAKARYAASRTAPRRAVNDEPGADIAPRNDDAVPTLSIRFAVDPRVTVTWKIASDSTLRVCSEQIWLTRTRSTYDYWLGPGDTLRLARGERIWLSSGGHAPAEVTLTSAWSRRRTIALAWIEWFAGWPAMFALRRAR